MGNSGPPKCKTCGATEWNHVCGYKGRPSLSSFLQKVDVLRKEQAERQSGSPVFFKEDIEEGTEVNVEALIGEVPNISTTPSPAKAIPQPPKTQPMDMGAKKVDRLPGATAKNASSKPVEVRSKAEEEKKPKTSSSFDRKAYQRDYMRKLREKKKAEKKE